VRTIWKYKLSVADTTDILMPVGAQVLDVKMQHDDAVMWALVDSDALLRLRRFHILGTGHDASRLLPLDRYVGSFNNENLSLVFHVFESLL